MAATSNVAGFVPDALPSESSAKVKMLSLFYAVRRILLRNGFLEPSMVIVGRRKVRLGAKTRKGKGRRVVTDA